MPDRHSYRQPQFKLVCFMKHLFDLLTEGLLPIEVDVDPRADLRYQFNRKGNGWVVILYSNSYYREFAPQSFKVVMTDHYKPVVFPLKLRCRMPVADAQAAVSDMARGPQARQGSGRYCA